MLLLATINDDSDNDSDNNNNNNKGSNILTKGRIADFSRGQCNVTSTSWLQQSLCCAVTKDCISVFASYTAAETPNAFQWAKQPLKIAASAGNRDPNLIHGSQSQPPNSRRFRPFWTAHPCDKHTDRQTDTPTCDICSNRPHHLCSACMRWGLVEITTTGQCLQFCHHYHSHCWSSPSSFNNCKLCRQPSE